MTTIHKFELPNRQGIVNVKVRRKAKFLKCAYQHDKICLWYQIDTFEDWEELNFIIYLTGEEMSSDIQHRCIFIDTLLLSNGDYVIHLYQVK